ncbi:hypothetical protein AURDEDRAFT_160836 [Auricularia subglabra TFB-10046 SS5]|nr:hypothetical protein AURDEDRAFT_160836 [Auricularia subglabra TFB-10046 SS5]
MRVVYRIAPPLLSTVGHPESTTTWFSPSPEVTIVRHLLRVDMSQPDLTYGLHANTFLPSPYDSISTLELHDMFHGEELSLTGLFSALRFMDRLEDLTIINVVQLVPRSDSCPELPFQLRRLVLSQVFPGWMSLLRRSSDTLKVLALGLRYNELAYSCRSESIPLSVLNNVRALRMDDTPDAAILSASTHVESLAIHGVSRDLKLAQESLLGVQPLARLTVLYSAFDGAKAWALTGAIARFSVFDKLRELEIETDEGDEFGLTGDPRREALADLCTTRGISVSVSRTRRLDDWERLDA